MFVKTKQRSTFLIQQIQETFDQLTDQIIQLIKEDESLQFNQQINIKNIFSNFLNLENLTAIMLDSIFSNNSTPEEKLRKISFDASELTEYLDSLPNLQCENLGAWGNQTWDLKNTTFQAAKKQSKSFLGDQNSKNTESPKKMSFHRDRSKDRTKYMEKLQQKLFQLVNVKKQRQTTKQQIDAPIPHYLTPRKHATTVQKTSSTTESQSQKCDHNFTNSSIRKEKQKSPLFKIKKVSKQIKHEMSFTRFEELEKEININSRHCKNKSMLTSYEPNTHKSNEVSIISYPVIDSERKPRPRRMSKLQDFKETFFIKHNPEQSKTLFEKERFGKKQYSLFRIKVSEPKVKENRNLHHLQQLQF